MILPKVTFAILPLIVFLAHPACNQLHRLGYDLFSFIIWTKKDTPNAVEGVGQKQHPKSSLENLPKFILK